MEKVRLGDVCTINGGYAFKSDQFSTEGVPVIRIGNITKEGLIIDEDVCYDENFWNENDSYRITKNDILIAMSGATVGKSCINNTERKLLLNQRVAAINCDNNINLKYIFYSIDSEKFSKYIMTNSIGCAQPNISLKQIANFEIPAICVEEQNRIAGELDKVADVINKRKQQLKKLDELVKARFVELFGDYDLSHAQNDWKSISEIGKVVGGATPKTNIEEYWDGEYRWITPAELSADSGYIYDSVRKLTKAGVDSCSLQEMPIDTVILSSRAPIGKVAIAGNTFYCNQGFKNIICNKEILPRYLYTVLLLNTEYLNALGRGATFKEISKSIVENIRIPVPPIELQEQFTTFVEQTDKSKLEVKKSLEKLELLKNALMQKYFG